MAKELGQRSRKELAALFDHCFAGWEKGVNMDGPDADFAETLMTPMELEARFVATEIGVNVYQVCSAAALAPVIIYNKIQKYLGPVFDAQATEIERLQAALEQHAVVQQYVTPIDDDCRERWMCQLCCAGNGSKPTDLLHEESCLLYRVEPSVERTKESDVRA